MLKESPEDTPADTIRKLRCHVLYLQSMLTRTEAALGRANSAIRKHNTQVMDDHSLFARIFGK
jgi:hypothetical protein